MHRLMRFAAEAPGALAARPLLFTLALWCALFAYFAASALLAPLASGPDETVHYIYSAAVVRGQSGTLTPEVPAAIAHIHELACFAFLPDRSAACQSFFSGVDAPVRTETYVGLYNPVFYAWTGLGSLLIPDERGLYAARLLSAVVSSGVFAWAIGMVVRTSRDAFAPASVLILFTPMVAYMCSVLNPSGWEIATTFAVVVAGYRLLIRQDLRLDRWTESHSLLLVAGALLLVTRGLSPLIAVLVLVGLMVGGGWRRARAALRIPGVVLIGILAAVGVSAIAWIALHGTHYIGVVPTPDPVTGFFSISVYFEGVFDQVRQMFGWPGWFDVQPPGVLVLGWLVLLIALISFAFLFTTVRRRVMLGLGAAAVVFLPAVLSGMQWSGTGWQGRYTLPLLAAVALLAGLCLTDAGTDPSADPALRSARRAMVPLSIGAFIVFHVSMAVITAHRFGSGVTAPLIGAGTWSPPLGTRPLLVAVALAVLLLAWLIGVARAGWGPRRFDGTASPRTVG